MDIPSLAGPRLNTHPAITTASPSIHCHRRPYRHARRGRVLRCDLPTSAPEVAFVGAVSQAVQYHYDVISDTFAASLASTIRRSLMMPPWEAVRAGAAACLLPKPLRPALLHPGPARLPLRAVRVPSPSEDEMWPGRVPPPPAPARHARLPIPPARWRALFRFADARHQHACRPHPSRDSHGPVSSADPGSYSVLPPVLAPLLQMRSSACEALVGLHPIAEQESCRARRAQQ